MCLAAAVLGLSIGESDDHRQSHALSSASLPTEAPYALTEVRAGLTLCLNGSCRFTMDTNCSLSARIRADLCCDERAGVCIPLVTQYCSWKTTTDPFKMVLFLFKYGYFRRVPAKTTPTPLPTTPTPRSTPPRPRPVCRPKTGHICPCKTFRDCLAVRWCPWLVIKAVSTSGPSVRLLEPS